jgi:hypothetical protein
MTGAADGSAHNRYVFMRIAGGTQAMRIDRASRPGYAVFMTGRKRIGWIAVCLCLCSLPGIVGAGAALDAPVIRPADEEYPILDLVVREKFLTSQTRLVLVSRMTATRFLPGATDPPSEAFFREVSFLNGPLPSDLVEDFVAKTVEPARLDARFRFGVPYRFVAPDGTEEPEARVPALPALWKSPAVLIQEAPPVIGTLTFSRVGFSRREDQALVYVTEDRPNGTGAGLLVWLNRAGTAWSILETEVIWMASLAP